MEALSLPLTGVAPHTPDAPHNAQAYELYLRANELARTYEGVIQARDLYEQCLDLDPAFAPAWAHLGRCHRVIAKFIDGSSDEARAKTALDRALALNPRLSVAHKYYAQLEADIGQPTSAMVRLLEQAAQHGNDPELFSGLVHSCRYCGLFEQAINAHAEAKPPRSECAEHHRADDPDDRRHRAPARARAALRPAPAAVIRASE